MGRKKKFQIKEIKHPSGAISYEASGNVGGKLDRKRFETWEEANSYRTSLEAREQHALGSRRAVFTSLTEQEAADAESALKELRQRIPDRTLSWAIHKLFESYDPAINEVPLSVAIAEFLRAKGSSLRVRQVSDYKRLLDKLSQHLHKKDGPPIGTHQVRHADLESFIESRKGSKGKTYNNLVGNLRAFFNWCAQPKRAYVSKHSLPTSDFEMAEVDEPKREILSAKQAAELMLHAQTFRSGVLVNYIATALFAGVRPDVAGELPKLGEGAQDLIHLDTLQIEIPGNVSKTRRYRDVVVQPTLLSFYQAYPFEEFPILPRIPSTSNSSSERSYLSYLLKKFRESSPFKIPHDGLRHSFCSYHVKLVGSIAETAQQAGDDEGTIRRHYMRRVSDAEAKLFWSIRADRKKRSA